MSKRRGSSQKPQESAGGLAPRRGFDALGLATLAGVVAVLVISISNWREIDRVQNTLETKLGEIEKQIADVSSRSVPPAARRGPDPNRVYTVQTAGAPSKGPAGAAVTIAEFSDFQ